MAEATEMAATVAAHLQKLRRRSQNSGAASPAWLLALLGSGLGLLLSLPLAFWITARGPLRPLPQRDHDPEVEGSPRLKARDLALVINAADPLSEAIGRYYQQKRRLPPDQVIRVRFPPGRRELSLTEFRDLYRQVQRRTLPHIQGYALAWAAPWRVGCVSITSAFTFGRPRSGCFNTCRPTPWNPWYARGEILRPWDSLRMRPSMLLAATDPMAGRTLIDRGVSADGSAPSGSAYLLSTSDPSRNVRAQDYPRVWALLNQHLHIRLLMANGLRGANDVIAYFTGVARVPDLTSNHFRPGAVGDHLTSNGGMLTGPSGTSRDGGFGQMSALRWLEAGATGSYGTVVEPCNLTSKFPHPGLLLTYYRRGDTLLESYWRSVAMPDQGVFIGEPLARPWSAGIRRS